MGFYNIYDEIEYRKSLDNRDKSLICSFMVNHNTKEMVFLKGDEKRFDECKIVFWEEIEEERREAGKSYSFPSYTYEGMLDLLEGEGEF